MKLFSQSDCNRNQMIFLSFLLIIKKSNRLQKPINVETLQN
jgi:hypothetical protein